MSKQRWPQEYLETVDVSVGDVRGGTGEVFSVTKRVGDYVAVLKRLPAFHEFGKTAPEALGKLVASFRLNLALENAKFGVDYALSYEADHSCRGEENSNRQEDCYGCRVEAWQEKIGNDTEERANQEAVRFLLDQTSDSMLLAIDMAQGVYLVPVMMEDEDSSNGLPPCAIEYKVWRRSGGSADFETLAEALAFFRLVRDHGWDEAHRRSAETTNTTC